MTVHLREWSHALPQLLQSMRQLAVSVASASVCILLVPSDGGLDVFCSIDVQVPRPLGNLCNEMVLVVVEYLVS